MQRDLAYEWNTEVVANFLTTALAEKINLIIAMRTFQITHILNHTYYGHVELVEHAYRFYSHIHSNVLWRSYNQYPRDGNGLRYGKRSVSSAWWKINY